MKNRKRIYVTCMIAIIIFLLRSFPKIDISTWSLLLMNDDEANFLRTWARVQRTQLDLREITGTCEKCVENKCPIINPYQRTDVMTSYVTNEVIQRSGDFSRVYIRTKNASGYYRTTGGDGWQVYIKGPSISTATVFDLRNGTYEIVFLPVVSGQYTLFAYLIYTACVAINRPPRQQRVLGRLKHSFYIPQQKGDSLLHKLQYHMTFRDCYDRAGLFQYHRCYGCCRGCSFVWNGLGSWEYVRGSLKWRPYIKIDDRPKKVKFKKRAVRKNGTLWFLGDPQSTIYDAVYQGPLCSKIFSSCKNGSTILSSEHLKSLSSDRIADQVVKRLKTLLNHSMQQPENALILNPGFIRNLPYVSYANIINRILPLIHEAMNTTRHAQFIWSTLLPSTVEYSSLGYRIYNAYANMKLCKEKVPILDLFFLLDSHSLTGIKTQTNVTLESVERLLVDYFELTSDRLMFKN
ncbi:uncharacterized protein LOC124441482 [Xenia sp. Carnegie-2017]|uniref:uncharacterized protein LOC124441482 n=1 Tax=Xenia sp. Carnegie-2017 TaxID=2897299 RepID=UPI001F036688|nr:uncharacterized protein LOC124441482 [Xenia sp. Carnegie-2017]XP_046847923.1 uncharacterized protein LOC124441482 [Xenia sp. Carnegie-2017]XP_046847924.1 uncharacterized protein LOC124441482 [Xenia sp. Carnegie-2017]XP_046847925.1 uncharacterized protein LOC124441482 [Xenia sp. Carnegie-2017]